MFENYFELPLKLLEADYYLKIAGIVLIISVIIAMYIALFFWIKKQK